MCTILHKTLVIWLIIQYLSNVRGKVLKKGKTIVFVIGGLRYDFVERSKLNGFKRFIENGVYGPSVYPVYPSLLYPNLYTIATGLYPENHGLVANIMYNQSSDQFFVPPPGKNHDEVNWWNEAEPVWITAENTGLKTALYWWPGCEVLINNSHTSSCETFRVEMNEKHMKTHITERLQDVLEMFKHNDLHLAMFYYDFVAEIGVSFGPNSQEISKALEVIDEILDTLILGIKQKDLKSEVNVIVVGDAGMYEINSKKSHYIDLQKFASLIKYQISFGSFSMILPVSGLEEKLFSDLEQEKIAGLNVYKKQNIPLSYHIQSNNRTLPILLQAEAGFLINELNESEKMKGVSFKNHKGIQGYDPFKVPEMKTSFFAIGPAFKGRYRVQNLSTVDVYNVICNSIGLQPLRNNGSIKNVQEMFVNGHVPISGQSTTMSSLFITSMSLCVIYVFCYTI